MNHPNLMDKIAARVFRRYLYRGQLAQTTGLIQIGVLHRTPTTSHPILQIMDYLKIYKGSLLRFHGTYRNQSAGSSFLDQVLNSLYPSAKIEGGGEKYYSIFELVRPITEDDILKSVHHISIGDVVAVLSVDRQFIYPAPETLSDPAHTPLYYTADSPS